MTFRPQRVKDKLGKGYWGKLRFVVRVFLGQREQDMAKGVAVILGGVIPIDDRVLIRREV
jgi:hypothetical protein